MENLIEKKRYDDANYFLDNYRLLKFIDDYWIDKLDEISPDEFQEKDKYFGPVTLPKENFISLSTKNMVFIDSEAQLKFIEELNEYGLISI